MRKSNGTRFYFTQKCVSKQIKTFFFNFVLSRIIVREKLKIKKENEIKLNWQEYLFLFSLSSFFSAIVFSRPQLISYTSFTGATTQCYNSMVANRNTQLFCAMLRSTSSRAVECVCRCARMCLCVYMCGCRVDSSEHCSAIGSEIEHSADRICLGYVRRGNVAVWLNKSSARSQGDRE